MKRAIVMMLTAAVLAGTAGAANERAQNAYLDGMDSLAAGKYGEAEKALGRAIAADEGNAAFYEARGVARTFAEDFPGAIADLQMAKKLAGNRDWEIDGWLAVATKMGGNPQVAFAPGAAGQANRDYAVAMSEMAQNYWATRNGGRYRDSATGKTIETRTPYKGDFARVAGFYVAHHEAQNVAAPKTAMARIQALVSAGKMDEALAKLNVLIAANPGDVDMLSARASALMALGDAASARVAYTDILCRKISSEAYVGRAEAATRLGDFERARKDIAAARRLSPEALKNITFKAETIPETRPPDPQELWRTLEKQAREGAPPAALRAQAAQLVSAMSRLRIRYDERYQERLAVLENELREKPNDPGAQIRLGRFIHDKSNVLGEQVGPRALALPYRFQSAEDLKTEDDRAEFLIATALREHPNNVAALTLRAHVLVENGDYDQAKALVKQALALKGGEDADLLELFAGLLQIDSALKISEAGNLKQIKSWSETNFSEYPPVTYTFWRWPNKEELARAAELEAQSRELMQIAEEHIAMAAKNAGATAAGFYYKASLQRIGTDLEGAKKSIEQALALDPGYEEAWFVLAGICTQMRDGDGAVAARAKGYSLAQTTAAAELNALWYKIPHAQFKSARETVEEGLKIDPADPRLVAYLGVVDEATGKPGEALAHYRMAEALCDAQLARHGLEFGVLGANGLRPAGEDAGVPAAVRLRIALLLLEQNKPREAAEEFKSVESAMALFQEPRAKLALPGAILPSADLPAGSVPLAQTPESLRLRAATGVAYADWAAAGRNEADTALAAKTYRRMLVTYNLTADNLEALKAIVDLGMAELHVHRGEMAEAAEAMKSTPAVPQDFWQEMRQTEAAVRGGGRSR